MLAHHFELRVDLRPLDQAALRWADVGKRVGERTEDIVDAARRTLEGWDAAAAESYERHRRQIVLNLDQFTTLASDMSNSLRALSGVFSAYQKELDRAWLTVAMVPHELVGPDRVLVFQPTSEEEHRLVRRCLDEAESIRRRLALSLGQESDQLRRARAEFGLVRTSLVELGGGVFDFSEVPGLMASGGRSAGTWGAPGHLSTSVSGSAQSGVSAVPGLGPITSASVVMPHLTGISSAGMAPVLGGLAGGAAGRRSVDRAAGSGTPPMAGGMGVGGAGAMRGGSSMRGGSTGSAGSRRTGGGSSRVTAPKLSGAPGSGSAGAARGAGASKSTGPGAAKSAGSEAAKESKRAAIEAKRAERAARKAERDKSGRPKNRREQDQRDGSAERDEESPKPTLVDGEASVEPVPTTIRIVEVAPDGTRQSDRL